VVNAILVHHGEGDPITVEAALVAASDALSAARPGVRRESIEHYLKRLEALEQMAFPSAVLKNVTRSRLAGK